MEVLCSNLLTSLLRMASHIWCLKEHHFIKWQANGATGIGLASNAEPTGIGLASNDSWQESVQWKERKVLHCMSIEFEQFYSAPTHEDESATLAQKRGRTDGRSDGRD